MTAPADKLTIQHVARRPLPWRPATLTECGLPLAEHAAITDAEFQERVKKLGRTRAAMVTCMTCWHTSDRYDYAQRPWRGSEILTALEREIQWARQHKDAPLHADLKAIEVLIGRHDEEFDELLEDQAKTVSLDSARKPKPRPTRRRW